MWTNKGTPTTGHVHACKCINAYTHQLHLKLLSSEPQSEKLSLSKNYFTFKVMDTLFFNLADF